MEKEIDLSNPDILFMNKFKFKDKIAERLILKTIFPIAGTISIFSIIAAFCFDNPTFFYGILGGFVVGIFSAMVSDGRSSRRKILRIAKARILHFSHMRNVYC